MPIALKAVGVSFANTWLDSEYPIPEDCTGYYLFGDDAPTTVANPFGVDGTMVGSPSVGAGYAEMVANTAYFDTNILQGGSFTFAAICEIPNSTIYCGSYVAGAGALTTAETLTRATTNLQFGINGSARISVPGTYTGYRFIAGSFARDEHAATVFLSNGSGPLLIDGPGVYDNDNTVSAFTTKVAGRTGSATFKAAAFATFSRGLLRAEVELRLAPRMIADVTARGISVS